MKLKINGQAREFDLDSPASVRDVLNLLGPPATLVAAPPIFAVAVNLDFVPRDDYDRIIIKDGDDIEILSPAVGG